MKGSKTPALKDGNYVAEWFGHRVWPEVDTSEAARINQSARACPFLTTVTGEATECVKRTKKPGWSEPYGVCTISSTANGKRQDWINCPHRTLDQHFTLLSAAVHSLYRIPDTEDIVLLPVTVLNQPEQRNRIRAGLDSGRLIFVFSAIKLGGEVSLPETAASPAAAVDVSIVQVLEAELDGRPTKYGQHLFYEIQTADFHGSPLIAAAALRDLCPKGDPVSGFHDRLVGKKAVAGNAVEGPNKSNIFKRTIYQMILKIALSEHAASTGFAIVIPVAVWDSWFKHLGGPTLHPLGKDGKHFALKAPKETLKGIRAKSRAAILVFEIDHAATERPQPLTLLKHIWCTSEALTYFAFQQAAEKAISEKVISRFRASLEERIKQGVNGTLQKENVTKRAKRATARPQGEQVLLEFSAVTETASGDVHPE